MGNKVGETLIRCGQWQGDGLPDEDRTSRPVAGQDRWRNGDSGHDHVCRQGDEGTDSRPGL